MALPQPKPRPEAAGSFELPPKLARALVAFLTSENNSGNFVINVRDGQIMGGRLDALIKVD
jgi:hypothetical protein